MAILPLDLAHEYEFLFYCRLICQVTNRNNAELESANAIHRAALAALKEECAAVLREKSDLLQQLSQMAAKVALQ